MHKLLVFILLLGCPVPVIAEDQPADDMAAMRAAVAQGKALSLATILPNIATVQRGAILEVQFQQRRTGPVYVITVISPDWRLWTLVVDARTGAVLTPPISPPPRRKGQS